MVVPTRRATAEAFQIIVFHMVGDASSPFIVGLVSDHIKPLLRIDPNIDPDLVDFKALEYGLFVAVVIEFIGGILFVICSFYLVQDKKKADDAMAAGMKEQLVVAC